MVTGAHGDAESVEQRAHVEMMYVAHEERHHGVLALGGSEESHAVYLRQALHAVVGELALVCGDVVHAKRRHIVERRSQSVRSHIVGRSGFELERQLLEGGLLEAHAFYHLAASLIGRHAVEPFFLAVEHTDSGRSVYLMSAEGEEVAVD